MNEKLKQLADQAGNYAYNMNPEQDSYGRAANPRKFQQDRDTKFAELIVRECAEVANGEWADPGHQIKQHFGVEE